MAVISHRYRCIFVKVPKCASTSVRDWFIVHAGGRHSFRPFWYHGTLAERMQALARALQLYPGYYTFSFVRNPYRRFESIYRYANRIAATRARRMPGHPDRLGTPHQYARLVAELLDDSGTLWGPRSTAWFRENARRRYGPLGIPLYALGVTFTHARPQVDFLPDCNPERLFGVKRPHPAPLDYIGTVETVDADFDRLRKRLRLPSVPLFRTNATPDSGRAPVRFDRATRRLVEHLYADDLALTGCAREDALPTPSIDAERPGEGSPPGTSLPASLGLNARLKRARYAIGTLEMALEDRLYRVPALRTRLRPLVRCVRGLT